ncbi:MAG: hypothetical protein Q8N38_03415 [Bacteroidales bacterium]|nr:hypothetical protein [Bacteroidales bacterium]
MKQSDNNLLIGILIFTIGFLSAALAQFYPETKILIRIAFVFSMIYLALGWYIFRSYFPEGHPLLLFIMGFLYSGVFIASVFDAANWPLAKTLISIAPVWVAAQILIVIAIRKKLSRESFVQFLIEAGLMLILSIILLTLL